MTATQRRSESDRPTLLLIHGAGGSPDSAFPFISELALHHQVIAPQLAALRSNANDGVPGLAQEILELLHGFGISRFVVIGYSLGSTIATALAARAPEETIGLMLAAGFACARPSLHVKLDIWEDLLMSGSCGPYLASTIYSDATLARMSSEELTNECRAIESSLDLATTRKHIQLIRTVDVSESLAAVACPIEVIVPERDGLVDPEHSEVIARIRPDATMSRLAASHALGREVYGQWLTRIEAFVRSLPKTAA